MGPSSFLASFLVLLLFSISFFLIPWHCAFIIKVLVHIVQMTFTFFSLTEFLFEPEIALLVRLQVKSRKEEGEGEREGGRTF